MVRCVATVVMLEAWLGPLAAGEAFVFSVLVFLRARHSTIGLALAILLGLESLFLAGFSVGDDLPRGSDQQELLYFVGFTALTLLCGTYPWVLRELGTPLVRPLRNRRALMAVTTLFYAAGLLFAAVMLVKWRLGQRLSEDTPWFILVGPAFLVFAVLCVWALVASVDAYRRADPGILRDQAGAFALAFGLRDSLFLVGLVASNLPPHVAGLPPAVTSFLESGATFPLGTLLYIPILAYGILRTQLFDLDLKVKVGISRSTVLTLAVIAVFVAAKVAELYLSRTIGYVAGGAMAGVMVVLSPRIMKVGDRVANAALPNVQSTPAYLQFKKLEVYKAAVESAQETGGIDARQRTILDKLRVKLGLPEADCAAIEGEVAPGPAGPLAAQA